jgi:hypothetical protein
LDTATLKQKAYIKELFNQGGLSDWIFNPIDLWDISKKDADLLIHNLLLMIKYDHEDLKDTICQNLLGRNIFKSIVKTVDDLEEENHSIDYYIISLERNQNWNVEKEVFI